MSIEQIHGMRCLIALARWLCPVFLMVPSLASATLSIVACDHAGNGGVAVVRSARLAISMGDQDSPLDYLGVFISLNPVGARTK